MENKKSKIFIIIGVIALIALCIGGFTYMENYDENYYTIIDNTKIKKITGSDMKYEYTLDSYNEKGHKKTIKFKTIRELREDAYILLEVKTFGVHKWEEISFDELPKKVKEKLK